MSRTLGTRAREWFINPIVRALLCSPAHRMLSRSLLLVGYTGRRSKRHYVLPVQYADVDGQLVVVAGAPAGKSWWRNFDAKDSKVAVRLLGHSRAADVRRLEAGTSERDHALRAYSRRFPEIRIDGDAPVLLFRLEAVPPPAVVPGHAHDASR